MEWWRSKRTYRLVILFLVPFLILYILYRVKAVLLPFILAIIIAYFLNPLVVVLEKRRFPRTSAILIIYLGVGLIISFVIVYGLPELARELNRIAINIPVYASDMEKMFSGIQGYYAHMGLPEGVRQVFDERVVMFQKFLVSMVKNMLNGLINLVSSALSFLIAPFLAFYILKDLPNIKNGFTTLLPRPYRTEAMALLRDIDEVLRKFIRGYLTIGAIIGILTGLSMALIGVDYAFIIGIIAAITDLIPYVGPFIGAVPAVIIAFFKSKALALYVILIITLIQQLESQIITPKVYGDSLGLHPLLIIFVLLAGGELYGVLGLVLALPVAAVARILLSYFYLRLVG